jgi:membrane protein insertase Oxa1/YidC/SpoIIIJ
VYSLPFIWAWGAPVFTACASTLISLQAGTGVPWLPFIVLCGVGVRLVLAPMMLRQMTLINKISQASPNIRMAAKLFKHSNLPLHQRIWHTARAMVEYARQTNTSLVGFYFYNIV